MNRLPRFFVVGLLGAAGCHHARHETRHPPEPMTPDPLAATQPSVSPTPAPVPPADGMTGVSQFTWTLPVGESMDKILQVLDGLGFLNGAPGRAGNRVSAESSDHFSAKATAVTAQGCRIVVDCEWVADGQTRVRVRSDLPADRHAYVIDKIRSVAGEPATTRP